MVNRIKILLLLFITIFFFFSSIYADNINNNQLYKSYDPIEITIGSGKDIKQYLLMNNGLDPYRWYYASLKPQIIEFGTPLKPDLTLIKFQRVNKTKKDKLDEGALFHCSFDIGADEAVLKKIRNYLPKEIDKNKAKLSIIPLEGIELTFLKSDRKSEICVIASNTSNLLPIDGSKVYFDTILDKSSSVMLETLLKTNVGAQYSIKYHYSIFKEPKVKTFNARIEKNKAFITPEKEEKLDSKISTYLKNKGNNPKFIQLIKTEANKTSQTSSNTSFSNSNKEIDLKNIGHKNKAKASRITNQSFSDYQKKINLTYRYREDKISTGFGFISLKKYGEKVIQENIIQDTSYLDWDYSYIVLPTINEKVAYDIKTINMSVELMFKNKTLEPRNYTWNKEKGWRDSENKPAKIEKFELDSVYAESGSDPLKHSTFRVRSKIEFNNDYPLNTEVIMPVTNGEIPITTPFAFCEVVTFDFNNLFWDALETDKTRLVTIEINMKDGSRRIKRLIQPQKISGTKAIEIPSFLYVLTATDSFSKGKLKANIYFRTADGKKIPWEYNDMVLNKYLDSPYFMFFDEDWKK
ncbi:MAG: hypothetical protein IKO19_09810 [Candidatus Riflebacteria bacterium]|nr:hypothetical protein [Candidatus Riflebacteria bacterium]